MIAAETKRRGIRLSGHIPRGMSMEAAVTLGYDEVQHAVFFFSNFFQDSLYVPRMRAYSQVAMVVAPNVDLQGAPMPRLLELLKAKGTVVDGTFSVWIGDARIAETVQRTRVDSAYVALMRRLYAFGIPMVAGTDVGSSNSYRRELELFEVAGIPRATILQMATIGLTRVMREERVYGSLAVGKVADVLVRER